MAHKKTIKDFFNRTFHRGKKTVSITAADTLQQGEHIHDSDVHDSAVIGLRNDQPSLQNTRHSHHSYKIPEIPSILLKYHPNSQFVFPKQQT